MRAVSAPHRLSTPEPQVVVARPESLGPCGEFFPRPGRRTPGIAGVTRSNRFIPLRYNYLNLIRRKSFRDRHLSGILRGDSPAIASLFLCNRWIKIALI